MDYWIMENRGATLYLEIRERLTYSPPIKNPIHNLRGTPPPFLPKQVYTTDSICRIPMRPDVWVDLVEHLAEQDLPKHLRVYGAAHRSRTRLETKEFLKNSSETIRCV